MRVIYLIHLLPVYVLLLEDESDCYTHYFRRMQAGEYGEHRINCDLR